MWHKLILAASVSGSILKLGDECVSSLGNMYDNDVSVNIVQIFLLYSEGGGNQDKLGTRKRKEHYTKKPGPSAMMQFWIKSYLKETMSLDLVTAWKSHFHFYLCQLKFYVTLNQKQTYITQHLGCQIIVWKTILRSASWQAVVFGGICYYYSLSY